MHGPFHTTDADLAATLRCNNIHYTRIQRGPGSFAEFIFEPSERLWGIVRAWGASEPLLVDAKEFGRTRRTLMKAAQRAQDDSGR